MNIKKELKSIKNSVAKIERQMKIDNTRAGWRKERLSEFFSIKKEEIKQELDSVLAKMMTTLPEHDINLLLNLFTFQGKTQDELVEFIELNWEKFLKAYWFEECSCGGHSSFWRTVILSPEWKAWKKHNMNWDFDECEELGIMSQEHWEEFIKFIKK